MYLIKLCLVTGLCFLGQALGASCNLTPSYSTPAVSDGWQAQLVAQGLSTPRSMIFDGNGHLLVLQRGIGITAMEIDDGGGTCMDVQRTIYLVNSTTLNHGLALSSDGMTIYASSSDSVYSWSYNSSDPSVGTENTTLVTGMSNSDHTTRTILMSQKEVGMLVVSRGSDSNIDLEAESLDTGHSQIKAFDLSNFTSTSPSYDFTTEGRLLGWGLRNSVGVAEEPITGGIYSVENSADEVERDGVDIHQNNPGEEMNFHGFLNGSAEDQGGNYGYPYCFALWNTSIPKVGDLTVGSQFTFEQNNTINDAFCASQRVPPRLTFQAHTAPLDIKFLPNGTEAFVSFHGSWDRSDPAGYMVSSIAFNNGSPIAAADSLTAATSIFANADNSKCPDGCFRPVGLALDSQNRLFVSSDSTGEIYVLARTGSHATASSGTGTSVSGSPSASSTKEGAGRRAEGGVFGLWIVMLIAIVSFLLV